MSHTLDVLIEPKYNKSLRLIFSYEDHDLKLISSQKVNIIPPPSDDFLKSNEYSGSWYSLDDINGHSLYRRILHHRSHGEIKIFSNEFENSIHRREEKNNSRIFVFLVPDISEGCSVALFSSPTEKNNMLELQPATELARFTFHSDSDKTEVKK
ncbi:hypothetical protein CBR59_29860 [Bacillus thuringiensis]|uniref:hypothetical protein n=1 Tax=Bacillus thuringiensis TaxID=1428 RepID=UPI000C9E2C15|nr:hypothetical protein [Bacillus thuringiensis]PNK22789.1 hypothetical protein CBP87_30205 [Bacillus thuringiensis]PNK46434.1 hypothetical protein CBR59_29860 [Bacillus thuringiensis]